MIIIEGKPADGISIESAKKAIWEELEALKAMPIPDEELEKLQNKVESTLIFSEMNFLNKAINLAFFENMGDASWINKEAQFYREISTQDLQVAANAVFTTENAVELIYLAKNK